MRIGHTVVITHDQLNVVLKKNSLKTFNFLLKKVNKTNSKHLSNKKDFKKKLDATEYLMATEANRRALDESIKQIEEGKVIRISLEDLWK